MTRPAILRFAQAIGDANLVYADEEYAKKTKWGGIIAPPLPQLRDAKHILNAVSSEAFKQCCVKTRKVPLKD